MFFGTKKETPFLVITKKPIVPAEKEIKENSRSRSSKLRIAVKKIVFKKMSEEVQNTNQPVNTKN